MTSIDRILSDFTDTELAYFNKYQRERYLPDTQTKISHYIHSTRGLSLNALDSLIVNNASKIGKENSCPHCKSNKLQKYKVEWAIPLAQAGAEDELAAFHELQTGQPYLKDKIVCFVCGHVLEDPNNKKKRWYRNLADFIFDNPIWSIFLNSKN